MNKKIITILFVVFITLTSITILYAQEETPAQRTARMRTEIRELRGQAEQAEIDGRPDEAEQMRREADNIAEQMVIQNQERQRDRQLHQIDEEIERLRQMTREAEEIRDRIAQNIVMPEPERPQAQLRPQALNQAQPRAQAQVRAQTRAGTAAQRQRLPILSRPGVEAVIDNIPQIINQLRDSLNNNVQRFQSAYQQIQGRLRDMEAENRNLQNEIERLRVENERLRDRLQERENR